MEINYQGKTAIITGCKQGIGYGIAVKMAKCGAKLVLNDIVISEDDDVVREVNRQGAETLCYSADISVEEQVVAMFKAAIDRFGSIDCVVNNAGITRDSLVKKMTLDQFNKVIDVNLAGTFLCCREAFKYMTESGGAIVNSTSLAVMSGNIGQANYAAAKAGIIGLTRTLASEYARYNIRVNAIAPGLIDTPMLRAVPEEILKQKIMGVPLKRAGTPEDVANVVVFLTSDMSSYITGQTIHINGGRYYS